MRATRTDPSANTIDLVGNVKEHLEKLQEQSQIFFDKKLEQYQLFLDQKLAQSVETSRRERATETARVDACRRDDNEAVRVAALASIKQAEMLATNVAENAETLRASMAKTAETLAEQLKLVTNSLDSRLKIVEEKQYTQAGASKGRGDMWGWIIGGLATVILIVKFILDAIAASN